MRMIFILTAVVFILFQSCVTSLHPLTDNPKDVVFKNELLGHWKESNNKTHYVIDTATTDFGKGYTIIVLDYSDGGRTDTSMFTGMLVNIKGRNFFDCIPDIDHIKTGNLAKELLLAPHFIFRVYSIQPDVITISSIDKDEFEKLIKKNKISVKHENYNNDNILITEKTSALQQKYLGFEKIPSLYPKKERITRIK